MSLSQARLLIQRQLRKNGLSSNHLPTDLTAWNEFLERIAKTYTEYDEARLSSENILDVSLNEMERIQKEHAQSSQFKLETSLKETTQAKEEIEVKGRELNNLINGIPALVSYWGRDLKNKIANNMYLKYFGRTPEQLKGMHLRDLIGTVAFEKSKPLLDQVLAGKAIILENTIHTPEGQSYHLRIHYQPNIVNDEVLGYYLVGTDVSALHETQSLLEEAQRVGKIGSWSFDAKTRQSRWSEQMRRLFNLEPHVPPPQVEAHAENLHPDDRTIWTSSIERALRERKNYRLRYRYKILDSFIWIEVIGEPVINKEGQVTGLKGTSQDVTEIVHAEEQVKTERSKAMQASKLASLGEMSAGIAHEVNNPLAIILGYITMLHKLNGQPEKMSPIIEKIEKSVLRIAKIISGLKKFSGKSGRSERAIKELGTIVKEAIAMTDSKTKRYDTTVTLEDQYQDTILCDEVEIEQVLVNLINNSVDAIEKLPEKWVKIVIFSEKNQPVLQLRDSGRGIPAELRNKLFDPFFTTKEVGKGTGLGLSITKGILEDHGASISILENDPNTCFEIRFAALENKKKAA